MTPLPRPPSWPWVLAFLLLSSGLGVAVALVILRLMGIDPFTNWF